MSLLSYIVKAYMSNGMLYKLGTDKSKLNKSSNNSSLVT